MKVLLRSVHDFQRFYGYLVFSVIGIQRFQNTGHSRLSTENQSSYLCVSRL